MEQEEKYTFKCQSRVLTMMLIHLNVTTQTHGLSSCYATGAALFCTTVRAAGIAADTKRKSSVG